MQDFLQVTKKLVNVTNASGRGTKFKTTNSTPWFNLFKWLFPLKNENDKFYLVLWVL